MPSFIDGVSEVRTRSGSIMETIVENRQSDLVVTCESRGELIVSGQNPRRPLFEQILESAHEDGARLYFETDGDQLILIRPVISGRILSLESAADGLEVEITNSHAIHVLRRDNADFEKLALRLRDAHGAGKAVAIVDRHGIIDVQPADAERLLMEEEVAPPEESPLLEAEVAPPAVDWQVVIRLFRAIVADDCPVANVRPPCIPFSYPTNWCWTRAHAMARIMIVDHRVIPGKLWIRGRLRAQTRNDSDCHVRWGWHVAPVLMTRPEGGGAAFPVIIDPSMFDRPVPHEQWASAQGDSNARLGSTSWEVYNHNSGGSEIRDGDFSLVDDGLRAARRDLLAQIADDGPPPYAHCPV